MIDLASRAPSNFNRQPWRFVVADTPAWCDAVNELLRRAVARVEQSDAADELFHVLSHVKAWLYPLETSAVLVLAFYKPSPEHLDEQLSTSLELREVLYGVFVIAIFVFFRRGVVHAFVELWNRLVGDRRTKSTLERPSE